MRYFPAVLRVVIGALFAVSGFLKLCHPYENFLAAVQSYEVVGGLAAQAAARVIPWVELFAGVFFAVGLWTRVSGRVLWALNAVFVFVVLQAGLRHLPIRECGCFGSSGFSLTPAQILALDTALFIAFAFLMRKNSGVDDPGLDTFFNSK